MNFGQRIGKLRPSKPYAKHANFATYFKTHMPMIPYPARADGRSLHIWAMCREPRNAKKVVRFYAPDAILLPTLSPEILINRHGGLNAYFASLTAHHQFKCTPHGLMTQRYGSVAINSGTYTFSYVDQHQHLKKVPARFTFVYHKTGNTWMIVNHHSSVLPEKK